MMPCPDPLERRSPPRPASCPVEVGARGRVSSGVVAGPECLGPNGRAGLRSDAMRNAGAVAAAPGRGQRSILRKRDMVFITR